MDVQGIISFCAVVLMGQIINKHCVECFLTDGNMLAPVWKDSLLQKYKISVKTKLLIL